MEDTKAPPQENPAPASADKAVIHRVCEACNNMFTTHPGSKELRCPNCRKG